MAKEAVLQVRMDADLKEAAEALYRRMGTSLAEAVRIFARQSIIEEGLPFRISTKPQSAAGILSAFAAPEKMKLEANAFAAAMVKKHEKTY